MAPIYLDYNATTPVDPAVGEAMAPFLGATAASRFGTFGNPSSGHALGKAAREAVARARQQVADLLGCGPDEIIFTSCCTESNNLALKGSVFARLRGLFGRWVRGAHIVSCAIEHPATLQTCQFLQRLGCRVTLVPVDRTGRVDPEAVGRAIDRQTTLVSIMHANNEVGTVQPIAQIAAVARARGVLVHSDAAQSVGKIPVNVRHLGVDLLSLAGHKFYAPKGVGALFVRRGVKLEPLLHGGGQEDGVRSGTENVPYLVGLGAACEVAQRSLPEATQRLRELRDRLWTRLREGLGDRVVLNGHPEERLPNTLHVNIAGTVGAELLDAVPEIAASTGSACHAGGVCLSPVLQAMGVAPQLGQGALRLSVGRFTTEAEIDQAGEALVQKAKALLQ